MPNQSLIEESFNSSEIPSLNQLLDSLGFDTGKTITASFVIPAISFLGIIFSSLSVWIFSHKNLNDPIFFYYRLLCIVYIIHLSHNIPRGLLYSPRYFPNMNTYMGSCFLIYYSSISFFLFHFEETLKMAILLNRMKIYSPFFNRHFTAKPWIISFAFFLICLFIDLPYALGGLKVKSFGTYYYYDLNDSSKKNATFYYVASSDFSSTHFGKILLAFAVPFLNLFLSVIVGTTLSMISVYLYKSYVRQRREKHDAYFKMANTRHHDEINNGNVIELAITTATTTTTQFKKISKKEMDENRAETNMFYMALTLCAISILSRLLLIFVFILFFFFNSFSSTLVLMNINITIFTFVPTSGIFIFYFFNKLFRQEFEKKFSTKN